MYLFQKKIDRVIKQKDQEEKFRQERGKASLGKGRCFCHDCCSFSCVFTSGIAFDWSSISHLFLNDGLNCLKSFIVKRLCFGKALYFYIKPLGKGTILPFLSLFHYRFTFSP